MSLSSAYRDFRRLREVVSILSEQGLGWIVHELKLHSPLGSRVKKASAEKPSDIPRRLRVSMERLGGAYIKFGQLLSLRPDLIPREYCEEFSKLQDHVEALPFEVMRNVLESELKKPLREVFEHIDETPLASASISQVYKARLVSGEIVAVKIQRPDLEEVFAADIDLLFHIATLLENHVDGMKELNPRGIVEEFERYTKDELNFVKEAKNVSRFYEYFNGDPIVKVPKVYTECSSMRVLVLEFIKGVPIREVKSFNEWHSSRQVLLRNIVKSMTYQVAELGLFHADPHPGNIFVIGENRFALLDFGIVGELNDETRKYVQQLFVAMIRADRSLFADSLEDLGFVSAEIDMELFKQDLAMHLGKYHDVSLKDIPLEEMVFDLLALARKYRMKLPVSVVLLMKSVVTIEGMGKMLDPSFNFVRESRPFVEELAKKRLRSHMAWRNVRQRAADVSSALMDLPDDLRRTLEQFRNRGVRIRLDDPDIEELGIEIDRSSNRITFGILIAAFVLGACLVILAGLPPLYGGIPILAIVLLIMAAITIAILIVSIAREKKR